jgi:hypothetical protein
MQEAELGDQKTIISDTSFLYGRRTTRAELWHRDTMTEPLHVTAFTALEFRQSITFQAFHT